MKDKLDELLDLYAVDSGVDEGLVNKIVARAEADKRGRPANENARRAWAYRLAVFCFMALAGFGLGQMVTTDAAQLSSGMQTASAERQQDNYLDRIILGPVAINDFEM